MRGLPLVALVTAALFVGALTARVVPTLIERHDAAKMVWCVGPGEVVDARFKAEYPDLYISKAACDAVKALR